ncbi:conserved hypothetical protein [Formivibrio citricus]|uniref:SnoaL-like domain-containing protein n=1 Tax=Formivibrio citricus TaxID=83765 RepID=A0A1I5A2D9_9NEIS|nr:nuclear transport factor 2 family protein [Formivibrio citricus]SFN56695.1 conserved hypothetical protein [Formivibrio citricus]
MSKAFNEELAAIEAGAVAYLTAFSRVDVAAVLATYADDGVLMAPGMPAAVGKDELAVVYPNVFATVGFDMTYEIKEVVQISADWGFVRSATEGTETNKATGVVVPAAYQELFLLRKSAAGAWQIARYCTSKISPAG